MNVETLVIRIAAARRAIQLYPVGHPALIAALAEVVEAAAEATRSGPVVLSVRQGRLYSAGHERLDVDGGQVKAGSVMIGGDLSSALHLAGVLETLGIESVTLSPGLDEAETLALADLLAAAPRAGFDAIEALAEMGLAHVTLAAIAKDDECGDADAARDAERAVDRALYNAVLGELIEIVERLHAGRAGTLEALDEPLRRLIDRSADDSGPVMRLAVIRGGEDDGPFHAMRVMLHSVVIGRAVGLDEAQLLSLAHCALLHDAGGVVHADSGTNHRDAMVRSLEALAPEDSTPLIAAFDHHGAALAGGSGRVGAAARIVAVADRYDSLLSSDCGGHARTPRGALIALLSDAVARREPAIAGLLARELGPFPVGSVVLLSDFSVGVVDSHGGGEGPVIRVILDAEGLSVTARLETRPGADRPWPVEDLAPSILGLSPADLI